VVLGPSGLRVHEANGKQASSSSESLAAFLVTASNDQVLSGRSTGAGIALTPVGGSGPTVVLPHPPGGACGSQFAMSADGAFLLARGENLGCAWRVSDSSFLGSVAGEQVTIRNSRFVSIERGSASTDVVQRDFDGSELSRRQLADGPVVLSPAGDRAITTIDNVLIDLDSGQALPWDVTPATTFRRPLFSPRGDVVLVGDGVFATADGVRRFSLDPQGRLATVGGTELQLAPDGSRAVSYGFGRATVFDVEAKGVGAVLGPPVLPDPDRGGRGVSDLALSGDGTLLVFNMEASAAFGIRLAPAFTDSQVIWDMRVELNLSVDVSSNGHLVTVGGDGRAMYDARDGHPVWAAVAPPTGIPTGEICLLDRLRFSPKGTWLAGSDYSRSLQIFRTDDTMPWEPLLELPGGCDAAAFSRDERLMVTSAAALYRTGQSKNDWTQVWSTPLPPPPAALGYAVSDVAFSPDESQLLVSRCAQQDTQCITTLLNAETGAVSRELVELNAPHPAYSPEGSWIIAANKLFHLPSGETRTLSPEASPMNPSIFAPDGDIIAGSASGALTRYCRSE
jgi:WD40 repeat protein